MEENTEKRMMKLNYDDKVVAKEDGEDSIIAELHRAVSPKKLNQLSSKYKQSYASAQPFPHVTIDDIFPNSILQKVNSEHPESIVGGNGCISGSTECFQQAYENLKSAVDNEERMGTYTRILFSFLKSSIFTKFLQDISGIADLIPDPHFRGSGLHFTSTGGNLNIHADFNKYLRYKLHRRVNMFLYLNDDWPEEYGGHLELWSKDMKSCYQRIKPKFGRFVVFSSTDFSCKYQYILTLGICVNCKLVYMFCNGFFSSYFFALLQIMDILNQLRHLRDVQDDPLHSIFIPMVDPITSA